MAVAVTEFDADLAMVVIVRCPKHGQVLWRSGFIDLNVMCPLCRARMFCDDHEHVVRDENDEFWCMRCGHYMGGV